MREDRYGNRHGFGWRAPPPLSTSIVVRSRTRTGNCEYDQRGRRYRRDCRGRQPADARPDRVDGRLDRACDPGDASVRVVPIDRSDFQVADIGAPGIYCSSFFAHPDAVEVLPGTFIPTIRFDTTFLATLFGDE